MFYSACAAAAITANRSWSKSCRETEWLSTSGSLTLETSCGWLEKRSRLFQVENSVYRLQPTTGITVLETDSLVLPPGQLQAPVGRELVLDYIVERKRIDDLCGSIIDGRFREQKVGACRKFRLSPSRRVMFVSITLVLRLVCSVPAEEVWSAQAHISGGTPRKRRLPPEFTRINAAPGHSQHPGATPARARSKSRASFPVPWKRS